MSKHYLQYLALVVVAFCPLLIAPFVYDDLVVILANDYLGSWAGLSEIWRGHVDSGHVMDGVYRPLLLSFLSVLKAIFGDFAGGFRLISFALHSLSAWLLFRLGQELFGLKPRLAHIVALVFLLHPIHVTHLDLIWKQSDLWVACFALLSLRVIARNQLWLAGILFLLGLGFKESALIIPVLWLVALPLFKSPGEKHRWVLIAAALVVGLVYYLWIWPSFPRAIDGGGTPGGGWRYFTTQLGVFPLYAQALVNPSLLTIDRNVIYAQAPSLLAYLCAAMLLVESIYLWTISWRAPRSWITAGLLGLTWLIPSSSFQPLALSYDETRLYLSLGFGLMSLAALIGPRIESIHLGRKLALCLKGAVGLSLLLLCFGQTLRFDSQSTLWREALRVDPQSARAHFQLGLEADEIRAFDVAEDHYRQAVFFSPDFSGAILNLGIVLGKKGDLDGAKAQFTQLLSHEPSWRAMAHFHLGLDAVYRHQPQQAMKEFQAIRNIPSHTYLADRGEAFLFTHLKQTQLARSAWSRYLNHPRLTRAQRSLAQKQLANLAEPDRLR